MKTGAALFGLHYHVAKSCGELGTPGFGQWATNLRRFEARHPFSHLRKIPSLEGAVQTLAAIPDPKVKRLALSGLAEGYQSSHVAAKQSDVAAYARHIDALHRGASLHGLAASRSPRTKLLLAAGGGAGLLRPEAWFQWGPCSIECGVSRVSAEGGCQTPTLFDEFAKKADPCEWGTNYRQTFANTYPAAIPPPPPLQNPIQLPRPAAGAPFPPPAGALYEEARFEIFDGSDLTRFRNLLDVTFSPSTLASPGGSLTLDYSLYESLTSTILGFENEGGLDVDSGSGRLSCTTGASGNTLCTAADKGIRFSRACAMSGFMNIVAFPFLTIWMSELILETLAL